jgi:hypothetical protein
MLAIRFAVQHASTADKVIENLCTFIEHLHRYRIEAILPADLIGISAKNPDDVRAWARRLQQEMHDRYCLTAAGELWFEEIRDAYAAAARRLDELEADRLLAPIPTGTPKEDAHVRG